MAKRSDSIGDQLRELAKRVDAMSKETHAHYVESALMDCAISLLDEFVRVCRNTVNYADGSPIHKAIKQVEVIRKRREEIRRECR